MDAIKSKAVGDRKLVTLTEVKAQAREWVWDGRIPVGGVTDLAGDPGRAKSRVLYDLAARITRGRPLPGEGYTRPPAGAVLLQAEDDVAATVKPTLEAMGADPKRLVVYDPARFAGEPLALPRDLGLIEEAALSVAARLVVVDPATAVFDCNPNADRAVREALRPLADLAARRGFGAVVVRHLHKGHGRNPLYHGAGSIAWAAAARSCLSAVADPRTADPHRNLLVQVKANQAGAKTLAYRTVLESGQVVVEWLGEEALTARDLGGGCDAEHSKFMEATEVLYHILHEKAQSARDVRAKSRDSGVAFRTLERAKAALGVVSYRRQMSPHWWEWAWRLPGVDTPLLAELRAGHAAAGGPPSAVAAAPPAG